MIKKLIWIFVLILIFWGFGTMLKLHNDGLGKIKEGNMKLKTVFENNENIPSKYTCDGEDIAPVLTIIEAPKDVKSFALIVDDPDAPMGTWVHWVLYNLPADTTKIDSTNLPKDTQQGMTDFGKIGWGGPCPPNGQHRYFFKLYGLDSTVDLMPGATKAQVENAIKKHIIEEAQLIGLYKRK